MKKTKGATKSSSNSSSKSTKKRAGGADKGQDAIAVLKAQHREVEGLFAQFQEAEDDDPEARETALLICQKLSTHAAIEEEIFYPAVREVEDMEDTVLEALEEHRSVKRLIGDIEELAGGDDTLAAKVKVLKEQVEHHVEEEEEELFADVKEAIPEQERAELGARLMARTEELEREMGDSAPQGERGASSDMDDEASSQDARES